MVEAKQSKNKQYRDNQTATNSNNNKTSNLLRRSFGPSPDGSSTILRSRMEDDFEIDLVPEAAPVPVPLVAWSDCFITQSTTEHKIRVFLETQL